METLKNYIGVKLLQASQMTRLAYNNYRGWVVPDDENPDDPGYLVKYPDGYESWSPKKQFEEAHREIYKGCMNFGLAVEALKKGIHVSRHGWNGRNMWLAYLNGKRTYISHIVYGSERIEELAKKGHPVEVLPFIVMKTVDGKLVPWLASQTDVLADDWFMFNSE